MANLAFWPGGSDMADAAVHPEELTLESHGLGKLDDASAESVEEHLSCCSDCQRRVAEMSTHDFLDRLRYARRPMPDSAADWAPSLTSFAALTEAFASSFPASETVPTELAEHPDYEIRRRLGRGGMGVVYLVHNRLMGRDEVLKVMGGHVVERPGMLAAFKSEIRTVAKLHHPNIGARPLGFSVAGEHCPRDGVRRRARPSPNCESTWPAECDRRL